MLKIRLRRMGSRHRPFYRVVVSDQRRVPSATALDEIGYYDPRKRPTVLQIDLDRFDHWVERGARPSDTVKKLARKVRNSPEALAAVGEAVSASARNRSEEDVAKVEAAAAAAAETATDEAATDETATTEAADEPAAAASDEASSDDAALEAAAADETAADEPAADEAAAADEGDDATKEEDAS